MRYVFKNRFYIFLFSIIDLVGNLIFLPIRLFRKKTPGNVRSILLIRLDHIGDVIYSTPIPQNLKSHYRGAKITFLVASWAKEIVMNNPYVDEVICYDTPWFDRNRKRAFEFKIFFKLAEELRRHKYDLGLDLRGDFRHILLMALASVKFRVGYGITGAAFLLHRKVNYRDGVHSLEHNLDLLRSMGIEIITYQPQLYSSEKDEKSVQDFLKANNLTDRDFIAIIHPYGGYPSKNWLDERFAELMDILCKDYQAKIILIGNEKDKSNIEGIIRINQATAINAAGKTSLGNLLALIQKSAVFIGVDSGPSHLAASVGVPMVVLYSASNTIQDWGPRSDKAVIIQKDIPCKDCQKLDCSHNICMDLISVDDVLDGVKQLIQI